jgi:pimeloyl-ACP methyl ester carboxylesterase
VQELALYARPWDFTLEDISTPVHLWHGRDDTNVPVAIAQYVSSAIPRSHLTIIDGDHLAPIEQLGDTMNTIRLTTATARDPRVDEEPD